MTCDDVRRLLHPFVDTELPPPMLLAVARHAGSCLACDAALRELTELREALVGAVDRRLETLDLGGVWTGVSQAIDRHETRVHRDARVRRLAVWGPTLALAAGVALSVGLWNGWTSGVVSRPGPTPSRVAGGEPPARVASRPPATMVARDGLRNRAAFDRLWGRGIEVKREPKAGTTVVWVAHVDDSVE